MRMYRELIFIRWRKISRSSLTKRRISDQSPLFSRNSRPRLSGESSLVSPRRNTHPQRFTRFHSPSPIRSSRRLAICFLGRSRARSLSRATMWRWWRIAHCECVYVRFSWPMMIWGCLRCSEECDTCLLVQPQVDSSSERDWNGTTQGPRWIHSVHEGNSSGTDLLSPRDYYISCESCE